MIHEETGVDKSLVFPLKSKDYNFCKFSDVIGFYCYFCGGNALIKEANENLPMQDS